LVEDRRRGHGSIEVQIAETAVVTHLQGGAGREQIGHQYVGGELLAGWKGSAKKATEIGLQVEELAVGERSVVIENDAQ